MDNIFIPQKHYKVLVRCFTYNHVKFITEALEGFIKQKTNFPYACLIVDDCSTDGTTAIINDYLNEKCNMLEAQTEELSLANIVIASAINNPNCTIVVYSLKQNLYHQCDKKFSLIKPWRDNSIYEAMCEGDDYWTDENKIQREVDFLDMHEEYSMVAENGLVVNVIENRQYPFSTLPSREILSMKELIRGRKFPTAGVLMRWNLLKDLYDYDCTKHDTMIWCWMLSKGKIYYSDQISSVYRRGMQGVCESSEHFKFGQMIEKWDLSIMKMFDIDKAFIYGTIARVYKYTMVRAIKYSLYKSAYRSAERMVYYLVKSFISELTIYRRNS